MKKFSGDAISLCNQRSEHLHNISDVNINESALSFQPFVGKFPEKFFEEADIYVFVGMALLYDSPEDLPSSLLGEITLRWVGNWLVVCVEQPAENTISHGLYMSKDHIRALLGLFSGAKSGLVLRSFLDLDNYKNFVKQGWTLARVKLVQTDIPEFEDIVVAPECDAFLRGLGIHLIELSFIRIFLSTKCCAASSACITSSILSWRLFET